MLFVTSPADGDADPTTVYLSAPDGKPRAPVPLDFRDFDQFRASPNGAAVALWRDDGLWTGSASKPSKLRKIVAVTEKNTRITAVAWDAQGANLVYLTTHLLEPGKVDSEVVNRLYRIAPDGTGRRLIKMFSNPAYVVLVGFDSQNERLYWFETGEGGYLFNLSEIDLATGKTMKEYTEFSGDLYYNFTMTSDFRRAYYGTSDGRIREFTLATHSRRTLHRIKADKPDEHGNESTILRMHVMPGEQEIVFTKHEEPSSRDLTYRLAIATRKVTLLLHDERFYNLAAEAVSVSGKYIWFETTCHGCGEEAGYDNQGEYHVFDVARGQMLQIFDVETDSPAKPLTVQFLGWLNP